MRRSAFLACLLVACGSTTPADDAATPDAGPPDAFVPDIGPFDAGPLAPVAMPVYATTDGTAVARAFVVELPAALDAGVRTVPDPAATVASPGEGTTRIALVEDASIGAESFRLEHASDGWIVRGGDSRGVQYGLARLLEAMGVRFFHPRDTFVPAALATPDASVLDRIETPEIATRGLHLHTIHPIEAYFDFWEPSPEHLRDAQRTIDWLVKNGGNFLTYPGLDDVITSAPRRDAWLAHTRAIVEYAHLRGVRIGIGVQLFGGASLQHGYVLIPAHVDPPDYQRWMDERLAILASIGPGDAGLDSVQLSFGEFSGEDPDAFIAAIDLGYARIQAALPGVHVTATIHVGNYPSTQVTYMGETMLYYFLVRYATPEIVPWVHTVMYFDLFENAAGAYGHDMFDAHRDYLLARLDARQPVGYHPETAYWVAFDNPVPLYLPLYMQTRRTDLARIREHATTSGGSDLEEHVVFSSGWEWGYWQNDWAVLRMSWALPADDAALLHDMLDPLGADGAAMADIVLDLQALQHRAFIDEELSGYTAGTDATFDLGRLMGVFSQPVHPSVADVIAMSAADRTTFRTDVVDRLGALASDLAAIEARIDALGLAPDDAWLGEIADGVRADRLRTEHVAAIWGAAADLGDGLTVEPAIATMLDRESQGATLMAARRTRFHDPDGETLVTRRPNSTLYGYGYLFYADTLCYWQRDRIELTNAAHGESASRPACVL